MLALSICSERHKYCISSFVRQGTPIYTKDFRSIDVVRYRKKSWPDRDSNPGPLAYRASTLPTELQNHLVVLWHRHQSQYHRNVKIKATKDPQTKVAAINKKVNRGKSGFF